MSGDQVIAGVYRLQQQLSTDALCSLWVSGVDFEKFNFSQLYAYSQVKGENLCERAREAEHFAGKLSEKKLDNDTIRTILETQDVALPDESTGMLVASPFANAEFFKEHIHHTLYLKHEGVSMLYDAGLHEGQPYAAFAIPSGILKWDTIPSLTNQQKAGLIRSLCQTIEFLHKGKTIHGGIRPEMVMPCRDGEELVCRILAAGVIPDLDKALESGGGAEVKELFAFCSPQQLAGSAPMPSDDVYSIGALLYYAFTGNAPWARQRSLFDLLEECKKGGDALGEQELQLLPAGINAIINKACAREPQDRYANVEEMSGQLADFIEGKLEVVSPSPQASEDLPPQTEASQGDLPFHEPDISTTESNAPTATAVDKAAIADITTIGAGGSDGSMGKIVVAAVVLVVIGIGGYFGYKGLSGTEEPIGSGDQSNEEIAAGDMQEVTADNTSEGAGNNLKTGAEGGEASAEPQAPVEQSASSRKRAALVTQGNEAMKSKRYASAIDFFKQAQQLEKTPDVAGLQNAAQKLLDNDRRFSEALEKSKELLAKGDLEKAQAQILLALGTAGYANDKAALEVAQQIRAKNFDKTVLEAEAHLKNGKWNEAEAAYAWALSIKGFENSDRAIKGRQKAQEEVRKIALKKQEEERQKAARLSRYRAAMAEGTNLEAQKRWDDALHAYQLALQIEGFEKDEKALKALENAQAQADRQLREKLLEEKKELAAEYEKRMTLGDLQLQAGEWTAAEKAFASALEVDGYAADEAARRGRQSAIDGSAEDMRKEKYYRMVEESIRLIQAREEKKADEMLRQALTIKGFERGELARQMMMLAEMSAKFSGRHEKYLEHINKANDLMKSGDPRRAALEYGRALVSEPDNEQALLMRGVAHLQSGNYSKALASFQQTLEQKPGSFSAAAGMVAALCSLDKFPQAQKAAREILPKAKTAQEKGWALNAQGWLLFDEGRGGVRKTGINTNNEEAIELFRKSYSEGFAGGGNNVAICLLEGRGIRRNREEGVKVLQDAAAKGSPQAQFNLGLAYYEGEGVKRSYPKAYELFRKAADGGLNRAWGRLGYMTYRGYGVERDRGQAEEFARRNGGEYDRSSHYESAGPVSGFVPEDINKVETDPLGGDEMARQFEGIMDVGRKLMKKNQPRWAEKVFAMAMLMPGFADNAFAKAAVEKAQQQQQKIRQQALAVAAADSTNGETKTDNKFDGSLQLPEGIPPAAGNANPASIDMSVVVKSKVEGIDKKEFVKEYGVFIEHAKKAASLQKWGIAEQLYRLALSVPGNPDDGKAMSGLKAAALQKQQAIKSGSYHPTDYEAVVTNAAMLLRDGKWPESLHMFEYAKTLKGYENDPVAKTGVQIVERSLVLQQAKTEAAPIKQGDERDTSSYKLAMQQAQQFMQDENYNAAIQMLEIVLNMKGFEKDPGAKQLLGAAKLAKSQADNSPEALRIKREQNKELYNQLVLTIEMHRQNGELDKALKAVDVARKLPGYDNYSPLLKLEKEIKALNGGDDAKANTTPVTPEHRAQHLTLMQKGRKAMEEKDWVLAEESFRLALQIQGFGNDRQTLAALDSTLRAQGKDPANPPKPANKPSSNANTNFIAEGQDMETVRRKAQFNALLTEGAKQFELRQYEVAEAILLEALKIKGYENNPRARALLNQSRELKPKAEELKVPEHVENQPVDATSDVKMQAKLLLTEGDRLRAARRTREALRTYSNGLDLDPSNVELLIRRGDTRASLSMFDEAMADYRNVLNNPDAGADKQSHIWNNIANIYYYGKKDLPKAVEFYLKAAQAGNAAAMNSLGVCYGFGKGVPKDQARSLEWYKQAASKGYGNAMLNLGMSYHNGWGTRVDGAQAKIWYERAAKNNVARAYVRLAILYEDGLGTKKDPQKAKELRAKAKELGYTRER